MSVVPSVVRGGRFTITEAGREALRSAPACECQIKLVGLLFECPQCGTIYGHMKEQSFGGDGWRGKPA